MSQIDQDLKKTPLFEKHVDLGARMVPFSGWIMPVQYSTGIIDEHLHTRSKAGLFDICHMGEFFLKGDSAEKDLERLVTCRIDDMPDGKCRYGFLLNDNGGIIDDLIVFKIAREIFMLVVNAGTIEKDKEWIIRNISSGTVFTDESEKTAKLDIQGPLSKGVMAKIAGEEIVNSLKRYYFTYIKIEGTRVLFSRTGYTGEIGYELFFPAEKAVRIWEKLLDFGEVKPIGLGARDTLRLEMGYSLYGHEIDENRTPLEANLSKFVYMGKNFIGKENLLRQEKKGIRQILTGFLCEGRRTARSHFNVMVDGKRAGEVTSGAFSPCLKKAIGLAYIDREFAAEGKKVVLSDGNVEIAGTIRAIPLYKH